MPAEGEKTRTYQIKTQPMAAGSVLSNYHKQSHKVLCCVPFYIGFVEGFVWVVVSRRCALIAAGVSFDFGTWAGV